MEKSMELKELTDRTLAFTRGQKWSRIKWQDEKSTYKGFHIIVKDKDGQQFELQIHSKESKDVKKLNHVQHQVSRKPNSSAYAKDTLEPRWLQGQRQ